MDFVKRIFGARDDAGPVWTEPAELKARLQSASAPLVIDVRTVEEFDGPLGHIDGARNIPLDQITEHTSSVLAEQRPVVLICHTDRRSAAAARVLAQGGAVTISILRGGMTGWRAGGH